jgi:hypothetical protein
MFRRRDESSTYVAGDMFGSVLAPTRFFFRASTDATFRVFYVGSITGLQQRPENFRAQTMEE